MNPIDVILMEMSQEAATTRRLLEIVPAQYLGWKPHEKSMTMGRLPTFSLPAQLFAYNFPMFSCQGASDACEYEQKGVVCLLRPAF